MHGPFLKWTREELKQMDQRTRKLMTMHKFLHPSVNVKRLYVSRKDGGRQLAIIDDRFEAPIQRQEDNIEKCRGSLITDTRNNIDNTRIKRTELTRKQKSEEKQLYGRFKLLTSDLSTKNMDVTKKKKKKKKLK